MHGEESNHPEDSPSLPSLHVSQKPSPAHCEMKRENKARVMLQSFRASTQKYFAGSGVLLQETELHTELLMKTACCSLSAPKLGVPKPVHCSMAEAGWICFFSPTLVSQHKEDFMSSPGSLCTKNPETRAWHSGIRSITILTFLRISMHQNQLAFATNVT